MRKEFLDGCGSAATLNDWSLCRLFGSMPSPAWLKRAVSFQTKAGVDVLPMDEHTLCFKLHSEDEQMKALIGGPWTLGGQLLCLEEWSMEACKRKETSRMLPVWLRIPAFPACLWNKRNLASVAAAAGTPIWMDKERAERSRLTYARIKVVVDCAKKPPEGVWVSFRPILAAAQLRVHAFLVFKMQQIGSFFWLLFRYCNHSSFIRLNPRILPWLHCPLSPRGLIGWKLLLLRGFRLMLLPLLP